MYRSRHDSDRSIPTPVDVDDEKDDPNANDVHQTYIFSLMWSMGAYLEDPERLKLETYVRDNTSLKMPALPSNESLYNYKVNPHNGKWTHWNESLADYVAPDITPYSYSSLLIPHICSVRIEFLMRICAKVGQNVMLLGEQGSGKTCMMNREAIIAVSCMTHKCYHGNMHYNST